MLSDECVSLRMVCLTLLILLCTLLRENVASVGSLKDFFLLVASGRRKKTESEKKGREKKSVSGAAQPLRRTNHDETDFF